MDEGGSLALCRFAAGGALPLRRAPPASLSSLTSCVCACGVAHIAHAKYNAMSSACSYVHAAHAQPSLACCGCAGASSVRAEDSARLSTSSPEAPDLAPALAPTCAPPPGALPLAPPLDAPPLDAPPLAPALAAPLAARTSLAPVGVRWPPACRAALCEVTQEARDGPPLAYAALELGDAQEEACARPEALATTLGEQPAEERACGPMVEG
jgi:hypothetical protein